MVIHDVTLKSQQMFLRDYTEIVAPSALVDRRVSERASGDSHPHSRMRRANKRRNVTRGVDEFSVKSGPQFKDFI